MIRKLLAVLSTCGVAAAGHARAESWRNSLELIDQWSIFTCPVSVADRYWEFTVEGTQLSALGPEGEKWITQVTEGGSFHVTFSGLWLGRPFDAEARGNTRDRWALLHNKTALCWYRLEPVTAAMAPVQKRSEWTTVSAVFRGDSSCRVEVLARISERPGVMRFTMVDGATRFQTQFDVTLSANGSGQGEYAGPAGAATRIEIPAGTGERILRSTRLDEACQWIWEPT